MAAPQLFYQDPATVIAECKAYYEGLVGKPVLPAQVETFIINAFANREVLYNARADYALSQMLIAYSNAPVLDELALIFGVIRLGATPAETQIRFVLVPGHGSVTIPAGTRVATNDGKIYFATDEEVVIAPGTDEVTINATATTDGSNGNNYGAGTIIEIIDPQAFLESASNVIASAGGAEQETDVGLRARALLAPNRASAGTVGYYKYLARTASPAIIDVAVTDEVPGEVHIYPLVAGGVTTPSAILDAVYAAASQGDSRILNDAIVVTSPTKIEYSLTVNLVLKYGAIQSTTTDAVLAALNAYCAAKSRVMGHDITRSQLTAAGMNENVHSMNFGAFADLSVNLVSFPVCTGITLGTVTYENINA